MPLAAQTNRVNPSIPFTQGDATHILPPFEPASPPDSVTMPPVERARYTLNSYAACLVHLDRKRVEATLAMPIGTKASNAAAAKLSVAECLSDGELKMDGTLLRGSLYRALYRADFWRSVHALSPQPIDYAADIGAEGGPNQYVPLHQYAECIVRADPTDTRNLLMGGTASATERDTLSRLSPTFSACLAKGSEIRFSKATLLGLLAEVMFRLSRASTA